MRILLVFSLVFYCFGLFAQPANPRPSPMPAFGSIQHIEQFPSKYIRSRNVDIWLPQSYDPNTRYSVLYMHDGQMLFDSANTWNHKEWDVETTVQKLILDGKIGPCIVVGIWNTQETRRNEYFPQKPYDLISDSVKQAVVAQKLISGPIESDNYLKFIVEELKLFMDHKYPTLSDPAHTFIAGSSMGGLISMYAICEYPEVFGGAACLSTHWIGVLPNSSLEIPLAFQTYLLEKLPDPKNHTIYFDHGSVGLDAYYKPHQDAVDRIMESKGYTAQNWMTREFQGAGHHEAAWRARLNIPLEFLMKLK